MDDQFDPLQKVELALLRAEHQKKFQVMINYLKEQVGEGIEYRNEVVRVVVSDNGAYYELSDLPEEFSGATGDQIQRSFVTPEEAIALLTRAAEATKRTELETTRQFSIIALYTRRGLVDRKNCYVYEFQRADHASPRPPLEVGTFQPGVMPLFFKVKMDADFAPEVLGIPRGIVFCMANAGDRHLLIRIPYDGDQVVNLTDLPTSNTIH
jgi:hypothetical protein